MVFCIIISFFMLGLSSVVHADEKVRSFAYVKYYLAYMHVNNLFLIRKLYPYSLVLRLLPLIITVRLLPSALARGD